MCNEVQVDCGFPGGNIIVDRHDGDDIWVHQDLRDTTTNWFYWCLRVRGAAGRTLNFHFTKSRAIGVRGPAVSLDKGQTWRWLGRPEDPVDAFDAFTFSFPEEGQDVRFSFGMPYQAEHWETFCSERLPAGRLIREALCLSNKGRTVEVARLGCLDTQPAHRVAITCRHHCCEMMANYVLEGLIDHVLTDGGPGARWLRDRVEFLVVPFADEDGVEDGDQGKNRHPHDHGRDYTGESIYPSVRALRERVPRWSAGRLAVALDLHCPHIAGTHNNTVYMVGSSVESIGEQQAVFSRLLEAHGRGGLPFRAVDFLPYGTAWNTGKNFANGVSFARWAAELPGVKLASGIEIPYAEAGGKEVNRHSAGSFGADLARALAAYLQGDR